MAGILFSWCIVIDTPLLFLFFTFSALALLSGFVKFLPSRFFGLGVYCFFFSCGAFVEYMQAKDKEPQWSESKLFYRATLVEVPLFSGTSVRALAHVEAIDTLLPAGVRGKGFAYLYFSRATDSDTLDVGDMLLFESEIQPVSNAGNPAEFDMEGYSYVKGITGSVFLQGGSWRVSGGCRKNLQMCALSLRRNIIEMYSALGFANEDLALLSALTVGEKREFPKELKESYAQAGASHVLALSGLHLGIFYMLLLFMFPYNGQRRLFFIPRELLVIVLLWLFAFVAGLSPSVVRAAVLFTVMSLGRCLRRESSPVNTLAFAALMMLVYDPHLLFDLSFQLSFSAVLSILLLVSPMQKIFAVSGKRGVRGYVVNLLFVSLAAQVGTFPFIWYHFGVFPLYFFLTNIIVVPMAFAVMLLAVIIWMLVFVPFLQATVACLLGWVVEVMNLLVQFVSELPGASYRLPQASLGEVVVSAAIILLAIAAVRLGKRRMLLFAAVSFCVYVFVTPLFRVSEENGDYLLIYNNRRNPLVHAVAEDGTNYLVSSVPEPDAEYEYSSSPYIKREGLQKPEWACYSYSDSLLHLDDGLLSFAGLNVMLLDHGNWTDNEFVEPVDVLVLCRGFLGEIEKLLKYYPASCVVLDASLYERSRKRILRECRKCGVDPIDISDVGAVKLAVTGESFILHYMRGK